MSKEGIKHITKELAKFNKTNHPAAKHLEKILENPTNKTHVLKHGIYAHCYDCSHDEVNPSDSHPKKCTVTKCPFYNYRPGAKKDSSDKKEVAPERKAQLQANAEKARAGRKSFKECLDELEIIEEKCKCGKKKKKDDGKDKPCECGCKCKDKE